MGVDFGAGPTDQGKASAALVRAQAARRREAEQDRLAETLMERGAEDLSAARRRELGEDGQPTGAGDDAVREDTAEAEAASAETEDEQDARARKNRARAPRIVEPLPEPLPDVRKEIEALAPKPSARRADRQR